MGAKPSLRPTLNRIQPFKAWLLWDADGTYESTLHHTRACAVSEKQDHPYRDAKWRIARVFVRVIEGTKDG